MGYYTQLKELERVRIYEGLKQGKSMTMIGHEIGRDKSTVSRELARNSDHIGYLYPRDAQKCTEERKAIHGSKISRALDLKAYILEKALLGWSPATIAGRWTRENPCRSLCAEAIYQFAYHKENKALALWKLFPRAKKKRGQVRKRQSSKAIASRVSIWERPKEIEARKSLGHYEADLMFNSGSQSANVLTAVERKSRMVVLVKNMSKRSNEVVPSLKERIGATAKSCTFDNGSEFALHHKLGIPTFFCDPGSPWQKGSVENMNGLLRRYLPFSLNAQAITQEYLDKVAHRMNDMPRKILGFLTPKEVFMQGAKNRRKSRVKPPYRRQRFSIRKVAALHFILDIALLKKS